MTADIIPFPMPDRLEPAPDPVSEREAYMLSFDLAELTAVVPQASASPPALRRQGRA